MKFEDVLVNVILLSSRQIKFACQLLVVIAILQALRCLYSATSRQLYLCYPTVVQSGKPKLYFRWLLEPQYSRVLQLRIRQSVRPKFFLGRFGSSLSNAFPCLFNHFETANSIELIFPKLF